MKDLIEACREVAPYLLKDNEKRPIEEIRKELELTHSERLRKAADEIEARDAAIERFRKALTDIDAQPS